MHRLGAWVNGFCPANAPERRRPRTQTTTTTTRRRNYRMKFNQWTLGLAAAGVVSLGAVAQAEEAKSSVQTALSHTVLSGYVNTALHWNPGNVDSQAAYAFSKDAFGGTKDDGFNLNVVDITLEKPLDEGQW